MRTVVMGGGVIGVTMAYYLAKAGHKVVLVEKREAVGLESSYQNGALLAPGHSQAWASPAAPKTLLKSIFDDDPALKFRLRFEADYWTWGLRFLANCTAARYRANTLRILRVMTYGLEKLRELGEATGIRYDGNDKGILYLFRTARTLAHGLSAWDLLRRNGLPLEDVDRAKCVAIEPALGPAKEHVAGGVFGSWEGAGDALMFTENLARLCAAEGVEIRLGVAVQRIEVEGDRVAAIMTDKGRLDGDCFVLALGLESPRLARPIGIDLPIYPIKGYTATVSTKGRAHAPTVGIIEEDNLVAFARLGDRLRVGGKAEFAGHDKSHAPHQFKGVFKVARDLFPDGADYDNPIYYACLRPVTPAGPPILGRAKYRNLYLNVGHGAAGWTMACGASRAVADLILDREPEMDMEGLAPGA